MSANLRLAALPKQPQFINVAEVAELLRRKPRTIYEMVAQERIPYRKVGGRLLFDIDEILAWTKSGNNQ